MDEIDFQIRVKPKHIIDYAKYLVKISKDYLKSIDQQDYHDRLLASIEWTTWVHTRTDQEHNQNMKIASRTICEEINKLTPK